MGADDAAYDRMQLRGESMERKEAEADGVVSGSAAFNVREIGSRLDSLQKRVEGLEDPPTDTPLEQLYQGRR